MLGRLKTPEKNTPKEMITSLSASDRGIFYPSVHANYVTKGLTRERHVHLSRGVFRNTLVKDSAFCNDVSVDFLCIYGTLLAVTRAHCSCHFTIKTNEPLTTVVLEHGVAGSLVSKGRRSRHGSFGANPMICAIRFRHVKPWGLISAIHISFSLLNVVIIVDLFGCFIIIVIHCVKNLRRRNILSTGSEVYKATNSDCFVYSFGRISISFAITS